MLCRLITPPAPSPAADPSDSHTPYSTLTSRYTWTCLYKMPIISIHLLVREIPVFIRRIVVKISVSMGFS
jgi:hypothetical protein